MLSYHNWRIYSKLFRPENIPSQPSVQYRGEFTSWADWLGCDHEVKTEIEIIRDRLLRKKVIRDIKLTKIELDKKASRKQAY